VLLPGPKDLGLFMAPVDGAYYVVVGAGDSPSVPYTLVVRRVS
jgi:hypothetical protein